MYGRDTKQCIHRRWVELDIVFFTLTLSQMNPISEGCVRNSQQKFCSSKAVNYIHWTQLTDIYQTIWAAKTTQF